MTKPYVRNRNVPGALFFGAFTAFLAGCVALSAYETYSLVTTNEPITQKTRYVVARYPHRAMVACLGMGALLGHLLWGPYDTGKEWWR